MAQTGRFYHNPYGEPCQQCGAARHYHRVEHNPQGDPCERVGKDGRPCGLSVGRHYRKNNVGSGSMRGRGVYTAGIDGEGVTANRHKADEDHRYVSLSWSNESGTQSNTIEAAPGKRLTTVECLDFILSTPTHAKLFAFAFNYDLTKILTDVDNKTLFELLRPELRRRAPGYEKYGPVPRYWRGYKLNMQGSEFTVSKGGSRRVIWDIFKFYQKKFTTVLGDWFQSVKAKCPRCATKADDCEACQAWPAHKANIAQMQLMKEKRHLFDKLSPAKVREYCFSECRYMAAIARKLIEAVDAAGKQVYGDPDALRLRKYHGAGSIASACLKRMGIGEQERRCIELRRTVDDAGNELWERFPIEAMRIPVAAAFAGGRFENRILGAIRRPVIGADISSAYPYQCVFLPCLGCGTWELTRDRRQLATATTAIVHYRLHAPPNGKPPPWGPFPFRFKDGSICFPGQSGGGWVWRDEYVAGEALFSSQVEFIEAWVYKTQCDHKPFADGPRFYLERVRIGKEGPGYILKLGPNAWYGKLSQSIGLEPPYQSWPWAGMVTSGCRAQMLQLMALHRDLRDLFMIATDGAYTTACKPLLDQHGRPMLDKQNRPLHGPTFDVPAPRDTGTGPEFCIDESGKPVNKPLGGWEIKSVDAGMFCARPGIYLPLGATKDDVESVRARGLGRAVMFDSWEKVLAAWEEGKTEIHCANVSRFHGAKSCIYRLKKKDGSWLYLRAGDDGEGAIDKKSGKPRRRYGQWTTKEVKLGFDPKPKREFPEGYKPGPQSEPIELAVRMLPMELESLPYDRALKRYGVDAFDPEYGGPEAIAQRRLMQEALEQPEGEDYSDYEEEEYFSG